jgi:carbonic anhydrase
VLILFVPIAYELCQTGTQQSPIPLGLNQGLSKRHSLDFSRYTSNTTGNFFNWGYGPAFTAHHDENDYTSLPSMVFNNETVYLKGWHIHAPADHSVGGARSKAELHYVHVDTSGKYRAVLAIRLDPGSHYSAFFGQMPAIIGFNDTTQIQGASLNLRLALEEVSMVNEYWTYKGSLTSPPCTEGVQWFVARTILFVSDDQMQDILRASTYSARQEQEVWAHEINV